jgi:CarD family transcriptional regulator
MKASAGSAATTRASAAGSGGTSPSRKTASSEKAAATEAAAPKPAAKPAAKAAPRIEVTQTAPAAEAPAAKKPMAPVKPAVAVAPSAAEAPAAAKPEFSAPPVAELAPPPHPPATPQRPAGSQSPMMNDRRPPDRMPAPRAHAKQETFVEGDHVVYPTHGVGKVERIATEEIAGHKLELIHITFEENRMTLRVPVTKAPAAGLRKLATRKMFDEALAVLKGRARIKRTMWSRRAQEYEAKINSGDPLAIAEVVRDLHRNAGQPDQSFSERQIYEAAMDRLAAELAALDKTDKATASEKLTNFLKTIA